MVVASSARLRLITEATHQLESPRAGIMRGSKCSTTEAAHVLERVKDRQCLQQGPITAHHRSNSPMSQGQALWEGPNAAPRRPLTSWGGSRTGVISKIQMQLTTETTHLL